MIRAFICICLRYYQSRINRFIRGPVCYRQCAVLIGDVIACCDVFACSVLDHCCARNVITAAYQRLAARYRDRVYRVAVHQFSSRLRPAVIRQRFAVVNLAVAFCRDRDLDLLSRDRSAGFLRDIAHCSRYRVLEPSGRYIRHRDHVRRCRLYCRSRCHIRKCALCQRYASNFTQRDRLRCVVDVRRRDVECYRITYVVDRGFHRIRLRYYQIRIYRLIRRAVRHRQSAVRIRDGIIRRNICLAVLYNCSTRYIRRFAYQRLRTCYRDTLDCIRALQSCRCSVLPPAVRQCCSVIYLRVTIRSNCQRRLRNAQLANRVGALRVVVLVRYRPREGVAHCALCNVCYGCCRRRRDRYHVSSAQRVLILAGLAVQSRRARRLSIRYRVDRLRMRAAVVCPLVTVRLHRQRLRARRYFQFANRIADRVVCRCNAAPRDRVGVVALSNSRLRARDLYGNAFCSGQAHSHIRACRQRGICAVKRRFTAGRQCTAVVFLLVAVRYYRQRRRIDL